MTTRVKICGITSLADAKLAADAGAWAIGTIFTDASPRRVEVEAAAEIGAKTRGAGPPLILSGGITPDNVAEAVAELRPFGVDSASGTEASPGVKDPAK